MQPLQLLTLSNTGKFLYHTENKQHAVAPILWEEMEDNLLFIKLQRLSFFEQSDFFFLHFKETCCEGHVLLAHCVCASAAYMISFE